ncbi:EamA family transporter RarD [Parashewanella curva]|uniref:EamA family transporter RarD n=1 Tax=Parashewanella curva TaxID=2338552 RepID=A0A3L8PU68_9GAMM|nr:EamA family transporter RarD [Parashewanella curva]RLV58965.1 EamA family transporter RarD [Parashewanella curva]
MTHNEHQKGIALAICAYVLWGIAPMYFKLIETVPATEILLHRVLWSFVFMVLLMSFMGGFNHFRQLFRTPKKLLVLSCTSVLIAFNWLLFIWAVNNEHMLDASLGYFINPLFNVVLGMMFLGERLRKLQWLAVALAVIGVVIQLISFGSIPIVSIALASSFAIYGLVRKKTNVDAKTGLLVETALLLPIVLLYISYQFIVEGVVFMDHPLQTNIILLMAGIVTSIPLLCFAGAAIRIPLSMLGFFQYIGPSLMFILATFLYHEPFTPEKATTFGFIWLALIIFVSDLLLVRKRRQQK